jgi:hypothetical protein
MIKVLRETIKMEVSNGSTDYVTRLERGGGQWPNLVKFTSFSVKLEVLRNTKSSVGSQIRVDDFFLEIRKIERGLIPYRKDASRRGQRAFLKDKLVVNG